VLDVVGVVVAALDLGGTVVAVLGFVGVDATVTFQPQVVFTANL
jgi:hypothetical protein